MNTGNYLPLNRKLFEHPLWNEDRVYSRFEAWLDLLQSAEQQDNKQLNGNRFTEVKRGELTVSLRRLAKRWKWSKHKVDNFFDLLVSESMIKKGTAKGTGQTLIVICNYKSYNPDFENGGQQKGQAGGHSGDSLGTGRKQRKGRKSRQQSGNRQSGI